MTPYYTSPEASDTNKSKITAKSDIFSFGMSFFLIFFLLIIYFLFRILFEIVT